MTDSSARASGAASSSARASGAGPSLGAASKARPSWVPKAPQTRAGVREELRPAFSPCAHMTAGEVRKLQLQAVKRHYVSHTDRYDRDESYRVSCDTKRPHATPRLLQYPSGEWANEHGADVLL